MSWKRTEVPPIDAVERLLRLQEYCGDDERQIELGKLLVFSAFVGEEPDQLAIASGVPLSAITAHITMLRAGGVFGKGLDHFAEYFGDDENTGLQLIMDISCGSGHVKRVTDKDGQPAMQLTAAGKQYVESQLLPQARTQHTMDELDAAHGKPKGSWRKKLGNKRRQP